MDGHVSICGCVICCVTCQCVDICMCRYMYESYYVSHMGICCHIKVTAARNRLLYIYMYVCMVDLRPIVVTTTDVTCVYMVDCPD